MKVSRSLQSRAFQRENPKRNLAGYGGALRSIAWGGFFGSHAYEPWWSLIFSKLPVFLPVKWEGTMELPQE